MKKVLLLTLILVFTLCLTFSLVACNKDDAVEEDKTTIVYLGDSICEGIIGPSPLSERDNYSYYSILGKINDYKYYNHSVSGHQTSGGMLQALSMDPVPGLLETVSDENEDGRLLKTHLKEADIIHISILGNNALQYDLGHLLLAAADPDFETNMANGTSLLYLMMHGVEGVDEELYTRDSMVLFDTEGEPQQVVYSFPNTIQDISDIVAKLKELNPNAKIIFQKVYNPVFEGTTLVGQAYWDALAEITDDGRFGAKGTKITTWSQRRLVAQQILDVLNGVLDDYVAANPGAISILDINKCFDDITNSATENKLASDSVGAQLLYTDWTHPSNKGHAAIVAATQDWLQEIGLANANAVENYKALRIEQINRMYSGLDGFDTAAAIAAINAGTTLTEVTNAYFSKTDAYEVPNYFRNDIQYDRSGETYYTQDTKFSFDEENTVIILDSSIYGLVANMALNTEETYFEFKADGTFHAQLQTKDGLVGGLSTLLTNLGVDLSGLSDVDLDAAVNSTVTGFFPGFTLDDLKGSLDRILNSLGVTITGLDWENEDVKYILNYLAEEGKLPSDIFEKLPADTVLTLSYDNDYRIKEVKTSDGKTKKVLYLGKEVAVNEDTQPFMIFEETTIKNEDGQTIKHIECSVDVVGVTLALNEIVA